MEKRKKDMNKILTITVPSYNTEKYIEAILSSDAKEVKVRNNSIKGIEVEAIMESGGVIEPLKDRIVGRNAAETIVDPETNEVIVNIHNTTHISVIFLYILSDDFAKLLLYYQKT